MAFSLLGPKSDWMDLEKGFYPSDIGGPMNIGEGYRWNIPVVTYGFDRSFLDYFGSNGVVAVEQAIEILNQVPPASQMVVTNYSANTQRKSYMGESQSLADLKTQALILLLEQMGLADSTRYAFCIRDFQHVGPSDRDYEFEVIERNFDPITLQPSHYVNETSLSYIIVQFPGVPTPTNFFCETSPFPVDPQSGMATALTAIDDYQNIYGLFATGLTRDDVGGLKYLLSSQQVRRESLPSDVELVDTNSGLLVQVADRPGIEKVTFVRHPFGSSNQEFRPFTNRWTDVYLDYDFPDYQEVQRVTTQPDIVFSARDLSPWGMFQRTGTTNWANNAALNGNAGGAGPGVIQPGINIVFNSSAPMYQNQSPANTNAFADEASATLILAWGSFDASTNMPIVYPSSQMLFSASKVSLQLTVAGGSRFIEWPLVGPAYGRFSLQTASDLTSWTTLATLTNSGASFSYQYVASTNEDMRFFRTIPQN